MKIYLDNCCYNRPINDQTQERIYLESQAILAILQRGESGIYKIVGSDILELEFEQMHNVIKNFLTKIKTIIIIEKPAERNYFSSCSFILLQL